MFYLVGKKQKWGGARAPLFAMGSAHLSAHLSMGSAHQDQTCRPQKGGGHTCFTQRFPISPPACWQL